MEGRENSEIYVVMVEVGQDAKKEAAPTSNQHYSRKTRRPSETVDCLMRRISAHGREASGRVGEDGGRAKICMKIQKSFRRDMENDGDLAERVKRVNKRVVVQKMSTQDM